MRCRQIILILLIVLLALPALAQRRFPGHRGPDAYRPGAFELVAEGAAVMPLNDLADDFVGTDKGMGASTGWEVGGRLRYYVSPTTTVGPAVHYADLGDWNDILTDDQGEAAYSVRTSILRVGLDIQQFLGERRARVRPYVTVGIALSRNRYEDWIQGDGTFTSTSSNLAASLGGGVAMGPIELSVLWTYNPVENRELPLGDGAADDTFAWNTLAVRGGIAFGR
jgi:opacity protein-like surface antigen